MQYDHNWNLLNMHGLVIHPILNEWSEGEEVELMRYLFIDIVKLLLISE